MSIDFTKAIDVYGREDTLIGTAKVLHINTRVVNGYPILLLITYNNDGDQTVYYCNSEGELYSPSNILYIRNKTEIETVYVNFYENHGNTGILKYGALAFTSLELAEAHMRRGHPLVYAEPIRIEIPIIVK